MRRKFLIALLALLMCATLLVGCSKAKTDGKKGVEETTEVKEELKEEAEKETEDKEEAEEEEKKEEAESSDDKTLTVATTGGFFPIIYEDEEGNLTGFEYEVIMEATKRAGYSIEFEIAGDYPAMFEGVKAGYFDTMVGTIGVTDERMKNYTFTDVHAYDTVRLCVRGDDPAESIEDMQGRKVCIDFGTVLEDAFNEINAGFPEDKQIELVITEGSIYEELKVGHYDGFPITDLSFDRVNEKGEYNFKLVGEPLLVGKIAFPFAKDANPEAVEAINKALQEMREDGTLTDISVKYFDRDVTQEVKP